MALTHPVPIILGNTVGSRVLRTCPCFAPHPETWVSQQSEGQMSPWGNDRALPSFRFPVKIETTHLQSISEGQVFGATCRAESVLNHVEWILFTAIEPEGTMLVLRVREVASGQAG